jgi:hypothetical protein
VCFFYDKRSCINFDEKWLWATFWAFFFPQTHPVALVVIQLKAGPTPLNQI